jgi:NitT/TauT family transport system substrate-binding protein
MRGRGTIAITAVLLVLLLARPALADDAPLRLLRPVDLSALPLFVMEHEHLIERTAEAMGLGTPKVIWNAPSGPGEPTEALGAGQADLAFADLVPFLLAADASAGTPAEIKAVGAVAQRPYVLVTRNPAIRTIRDFTAADRIAVPATKVSGPAVMLEMAAAQEWGIERFDKLDRLAVARPDAVAAVALQSPKPDISAHFSRTPQSDIELSDPAIHRVMDSFDIAGPHSSAVLAATTRFRAANRELVKAILSALQDADDFIKKSPGAAAEIFVGMAPDQDIPLEDVSDMIGDPDFAYTAAPAGVMRLADFLHRIGRLKRRPGSWQDVFFPEARDLPGH